MKRLLILKNITKIATISIVFLLAIGYIDSRATNAAEVTVDGVISLKELNTSPATIIGYGQIYAKTAGRYTSDSYTKLLLHADISTGFNDSSTSNHPVSVYGAYITTASSKLGGASGYFDGLGDYLSIPDSEDWNFWGGDFTIDFWINPPTSPNTNANVVGQWINNGSTSQSWIVELEGTNNRQISFYTYNLGYTQRVLLSSTVLPTGSFSHVAIVRNGTNLNLYINGVSESSYNIGNETFVNSTAPLLISTDSSNPTCYLAGYIDELRISKGIARWTSNFTPNSTGGLFYKTGSGSEIPLAVE